MIQTSSIPQLPLLIPVEEVARMFSISTRSVWRLRSAGKLPEPIRIGGSVRWRTEEVAEWMARGCPSPTT